MAEENKQEQKSTQGQGSGGSQKQEKHGLNLLHAQEASAEYGKATESDSDDLFDESAGTKVYAADIGYSVQSHGDGQPTMAPEHVELREAEAERNADPDAENKAFARDVLGLDV